MTEQVTSKKIAIVHDYFVQRGGGERVAGVLHSIYPTADIYTLVKNESKLWDDLKGVQIKTSWVQRIPGAVRWFKFLFWVYPWAIQTMDLSDYDIVISSSSAYAKGVKTKSKNKKAYHICYCHTPMRFAWSFDNYIENETNNKFLKFAASIFISWLRRWDVKRSKHVDLFVANSSAVKKRIRNCYDREAQVVFPPVALERFNASPNHEDYFLIVSRLVAYKRIDLAVRTCANYGLKLLIVGEGPDRDRLKGLGGPTVEFLGWLPEKEVSELMSKCMAFIFPGEEDFGMTPVEVNACGRPVVAYRAGGALDTIIDGVNGLFFCEQSELSLVEALKMVAEVKWDSTAIRQSAFRFSTNTFIASIRALVDGVTDQRDYSYGTVSVN